MIYFPAWESDYKQLVRAKLLARASLVRAVFSGAQKGTLLSWDRVIVRPVELKGEIHLQFSYFDEERISPRIILKMPR